MARQIVKKSFYIYCNKFKQFIPYGCVYSILFLLFSYFSLPLYFMTPLLIIIIDIPGYSLFYNISPLAALRQNIKTLLFFALSYAIINFVLQYISHEMTQIMNAGIEKGIVSIFFSIISTILYVSCGFLLTYSIKGNCGINKSLTAYADVFSKNKAWNIGLYIKIVLFEFIFVFVFYVAMGMITSALLPFFYYAENAADIMVTFVSAVADGLFYPYVLIRMCNYYEEIC